MTLEEIDLQIENRAMAFGPVIAFSSGYPILLGIGATKFWSMTRNLPAVELPATFLAGGARHSTPEEAIRWCKAFARKHPDRFGVEAAK